MAGKGKEPSIVEGAQVQQTAGFEKKDNNAKEAGKGSCGFCLEVAGDGEGVQRCWFLFQDVAFFISRC